jgi:hypothetical protein
MEMVVTKRKKKRVKKCPKKNSMGIEEKEQTNK